MKIIAGKLKGKKIMTLPGILTRPTLTRIKENIFNILHNHTDFQKLVVVDVFAGSGSLALEAISRGASLAYLSFINESACAVIKNNIKQCRFASFTKVTHFDYQTFFQNFTNTIDLLFIDPPFANITCQQWIIDYCVINNLLNDKALIMLETNRELVDLKLISNFTILSSKKYSNIYIKIMQFHKRIS